MRMYAKLGLLAALTLLALGLSGGGAREVQAQQPLVVGLDMNMSGNTCPGGTGGDCTLGTINAHRMVHRGDIFEADVFLQNLPAGESIGGFSYDINFPDVAVEVIAARYTDTAVNLLTQKAGSNLVDASESVPDPVSPHSVAVADLGVGSAESNPPFTRGVLGRYTLRVLPTAPSGLYRLTLANLWLERDWPPGGNLCADYGCTVVDGDTGYGMIEVQPPVVGFDMNAAGNTCPGGMGQDCTLGTINAHRTAQPGDTFQVDIFLQGLPAAESIRGFSYDINFPDTAVEVIAARYTDTAVNLLTQKAGSNLVDASESVPDSVSSHRVAVADLGSAESNPPFTRGVLGRYTLRVLPTAPSGLYRLTLASVWLERDWPPGGNLCADHGCSVVDGDSGYGMIAVAVPTLVVDGVTVAIAPGAGASPSDPHTLRDAYAHMVSNSATARAKLVEAGQRQDNALLIEVCRNDPTVDIGSGYTGTGVGRIDLGDIDAVRAHMMDSQQNIDTIMGGLVTEIAAHESEHQTGNPDEDGAVSTENVILSELHLPWQRTAPCVCQNGVSYIPWTVGGAPVTLNLSAFLRQRQAEGGFCEQCCNVGGTVELRDGTSALSARGAEAASPNYVALAGGSAAALLVLTAGGLYASRRFRQTRIRP